MIPFEQGYDRCNDLQEPDWEIIKPNLWAERSKEPSIKESRELKKASVSKYSVSPTGVTDDVALKSNTGSGGYQPLHDPKNQLSSLVKNAQNNKEALQQRNERLKHSRMRARKEYGW